MSWKGRKRGKKIGPRPTCYFPDDDLCLWVRLWGLCARAKIYCFPTNSRRVSSCSPVHCPCVDMLLSEAQSSPHYSKSNFTLHPNWVKKPKKLLLNHSSGGRIAVGGVLCSGRPWCGSAPGGWSLCAAAQWSAERDGSNTQELEPPAVKQSIVSGQFLVYSYRSVSSPHNPARACVSCRV